MTMFVPGGEVDDAARAGVLTGEIDVTVDRDGAGRRRRVELAAIGEPVAEVGKRADAGTVEDGARLQDDVLRRDQADRPPESPGDVDVPSMSMVPLLVSEIQSAADDETVRVHEVARGPFQLTGRGEG
jgi:hypothetical protein